MRYLSVCSGIAAATVAWHPLGWEPVAFSEIEKFPNAVLQHHYPDVPNHGDMTDHEQWPETSIDVLVGGTPCQSFSVAGLRAGMADPRGNLALVYIAIAEQYRPEWLVWENVPGVLSSNGGRDFGSIIGGMVELGYRISYRVLDAQYFGVPQRRRRVLVVGHSGSWERAAQVLLEPACLRRDPAPSREAGQAVAAGLTAGSSAGSNAPGRRREDDVNIVSHDPAMTLTAREYKGPLPEADLSTVVAHSLRGEGFDASEDGTGRGTPIVVQGGSQQDQFITKDGISPTLAHSSNTHSGHHQPKYVDHDMAVRRLTPLECTRLQGFPDDYFDGVPGRSDSAVYKALGNSMAVPVMRWIGRRIQMVNE